MGGKSSQIPDFCQAAARGHHVMQATGAAQKTKRGHRQRVTCKARNLERGFKKKNQRIKVMYVYIYILWILWIIGGVEFSVVIKTLNNIFIYVYIYI
jgi:hypothetical protein